MHPCSVLSNKAAKVGVDTITVSKVSPRAAQVASPVRHGQETLKDKLAVAD